MKAGAAPPERTSPDPGASSAARAKTTEATTTTTKAPQASASDAAARSRTIVLILVLVASLAGLGVAALLYRSYAAVHLRPIAKMPRCVLLMTRVLPKPSLVSGSEPYPTADGEVYLTPNENRAVSCVEQISKPLAEKFARAFAEHEPEIRGLELLKTVRDLPPDASADKEATAAYFIALSAMRALPDMPETKAAFDELSQLHACRFSTRKECPTRPPIPMTVWLVGGPSALGLCFVMFVFGRAGVRLAITRIRARRERKKTRKARKAEPSEQED